MLYDCVTALFKGEDYFRLVFDIKSELFRLKKYFKHNYIRALILGSSAFLAKI